MKYLKTVSIFILAVTLSSCSDGSIHEKAISDFVQTDKKGVWTDLKFKVIEMGEPVMITVADSTSIVTEVFEADKAKKLDFANEGIERNRKSLEKEKLPVMKKFYQDYIDKQTKVVDSLNALTVVLPDSYATKTATDVLAQEVVCKFSIVPMGASTTQEITATFVLNAAGDKCYRRKLNK